MPRCEYKAKRSLKMSSPVRTIYLHGRKLPTENGAQVYCDFHSQSVIFLLHFCKSKSFQVTFIDGGVDLPYKLCSNALSGLDVTFISHEAAPTVIQACCLPAVSCDGESLIRAGFGCTLRYIVTVADALQPSTDLIELLGLKGVCLKSCAETSVWTHFCEVEIANSLDSVIQGKAGAIVDENGQKKFEIPLPVMKLENHFESPPIIRNRSKHKQAAVKKLLENKNTSSNQAKVTKSEITKMRRETDYLEDLQHHYVEGTRNTLADIILYPAFVLMLDKWTSIGKSLEPHIPRIIKWLSRMRDNERIIHAHKICCLPELSLQSYKHPVSIEIPSSADKLLNIRETKKKLKAKPDMVQEIQEKLKTCKINVEEFNHPWDSSSLDWSNMPSATHPKDGELPLSRLERKCRQLENLVAAVRWVAKSGDTIVDFCAGGGHLGIILAYLLPDCQVIMVENKEESITRAQRRINSLELKNATLYQCNLDYFHGNFDVGVCLHACGVATDLVLQTCLKKKASFVLCPCCYGSIHDNHVTTYPRSKMYKEAGLSIKEYEVLGHAGDQTQQSSVLASQGKMCMQLIDTDRLKEAEEQGYKVHLTSLKPLTCSPKNNLLLGVKSSKS